jgi:hypothetical protein
MELNGKECPSVNEDRRHARSDGSAVGEEDSKLLAQSQVYEIRVKSHLNGSWSEWFEGLGVKHAEDGTTVLTGLVADQPALHGLLVKIRDLGLPLVSVICLEAGEGELPGRLI